MVLLVSEETRRKLFQKIKLQRRKNQKMIQQKQLPLIQSPEEEQGSELLILKISFWQSKDAPVRTRSAFRTSEDNLLSLVSLTEPTSVNEALLNKDLVLAAKEEVR